jgi:prolyl-tRNA synthetase
MDVAGRVAEALRGAGKRVELDAREGLKPGAKYYEWEGRGVPLRIEIGPRDVGQGQVTLARRTGGKSPLRVADLVPGVSAMLDGIQRELLDAARMRREQNSRRGVSREELVAMMAGEGGGGFAYAGFCGSRSCEDAVKEETKATIRVLPDEEFRSPTAPERCVWCGKPASAEAVWAKAY